MTERPLAAVVLAAGQGKRLRAPGPKVLVEVCGRALVEHVLAALQPLGARPTVVVYGHGGDAVRRALRGRDLLFAHQEEQRGTGHAVQCALPSLGDFAGDVLILCGDTPLLTTEVLRALVEDHRANRRALTLLSAEMREPGSLGRVLRGPDGRMSAIREVADATPEERAVREINTGVIVADSAHLGAALARVTPENAQGEYYLTDVPRLLLEDGLPVAAFRTDDEGSAMGVNRPEELAEAGRLLRERILGRAMAAGVRIEDPRTTVLDAGAEVGAGTVLRPFTHVGSDVRVGKDCRIGPHAFLSEGVVVAAGVTLGTHVEVRRATIESGARVPGPARLVDVVVGRDVLLGPGVVAVAGSGGRTVIGEGAEIGAGCLLEAPATVGEGVRVEPGTVMSGTTSPAGVENA